MMHMKPKSFLFLLLLLLAGFSLPGCGSADGEQVVVTEVVNVEGEEQVITRVVTQRVTATAVAPPAAEEVPIVLDIGLVLDEFPTLDPQVTDDPQAIDLIENLFIGLTRYDHAQNQIAPALAEGWNVSQNGRTWTFKLRDDVFWVRPAERMNQNYWQVEAVAPVVAADVVYAVQRACARETGTPDVVVLFIIEGCEQVHSLAEPTEVDFDRIGVTAVDDTTLQFTLVKPAAHFLTITSMWLMRPVPRTLVEAEPTAWTDPENLVTSGPFVPLPESRRLQRNPVWPFEFSGNVDIVNIFFLDSPINGLQLWNAKQLDLTPLPTDIDPEERERLASRTRLVPSQTVFYLGFNFDSGAFRELEVRRAFSAAIDRERLVTEIYGDRAAVMRHFVPPGVIGASPIGEVGMGYDPDYARQQLADSGFRSCRLMPPIRFLVTSADLSLLQAELIRDMWIEELGCTEEQIIIEQVQFGTLLANTRGDAGAARPDLWELGWASYYPDAHNWLGDLLHCVDSENRQNRPCSEVDELIRQANNSANSEERAQLYRQIESLFFSKDGTLPIAPLYVTGSEMLVQSWLTTYTPAMFGGDQYDTFFVDAVTKRLERSRDAGN